MLDRHLIAKTSPKANAENVVLWRDYRITVLQDRLFRIEKSQTGRFRDGATQIVWFRDLPPQKFRAEEKGDSLEISTRRCTLVVKPAREDCRIRMRGKELPVSNEGNLLGTYRTLDGCDGPYTDTSRFKEQIELGNGVCSRTGVACFGDDSLTLGEDGMVCPRETEGSDEYVFAYGSDYRAAVKALYRITGPVPLVPRYALGNWWSRYRAYTAEEYLTLMEKFAARRVPLTVATVDMDWHYSVTADKEFRITEQGKDTPRYGRVNGGWTGYTWNEHLFPDYKSFLKELHAMGLKVTLNLHPADGVRWWEKVYPAFARRMGIDPATEAPVPFDVADPAFINAYFELIHKPYEHDGVDFWWIDWQQGVNSAMAGLDPLWSLNHYHTLDLAKEGRRPLILSRYAGIGSHRYPLGFTGDTIISWETLRYLPYFTATASNVGYTWWSHDIGGHMGGVLDCELYVRHVEYGVFSPINRLHGTSDPVTTKEPWVYGNGTGLIAEEQLRFRHRMIPFLYTADIRTHEEGLALVEPLYYRYNTRKAYAFKNEYLFGGLLVSPVTEPRKADGYARVKTWIPEGRWTDLFTGDVYVSPRGGAVRTLLRTLDSIPVLAPAGTVLPLSADEGNSADNPEKLEVLVFNGNGRYTLREDGLERGETGRYETAFTLREGEGVQEVEFVSKGDPSVVPGNRTILLTFRNLKAGEVTVWEDGTPVRAERVRGDFLTVKIVPKAGKTYRVAAAFGAPFETLKERADRLLAGIEGARGEKSALYSAIVKSGTAEEYAAAVDASPLSKGAKLRLKETL